MKRYEKLSKEEIIELSKGFIDCKYCPMHDDCNGCQDCIENYEHYMNEEIETIPRAWTFKTAKEAYEAGKEFRKTHCFQKRCIDCRYSASKNNGTICELNWLYEEVEK